MLALIAIEVARLAASRARTGSVTLAPADATVEALRRLVEEHFRKERLIGFYAEKLAMTADRLNDHVKRATGVTAGHLIRQRVLTEAKRQLVFTSQPIHEIAYDLGFCRPVAFRALLPQADRHDAAGIPRGPGRLTPSVATEKVPIACGLILNLPCCCAALRAVVGFACTARWRPTCRVCCATLARFGAFVIVLLLAAVWTRGRAGIR